MSHSTHRATRWAVVPLAACAVAAMSVVTASPAAAQAQAQRIVIDPATGRARMPEHDELAAPASAARAAPGGTLRSQMTDPLGSTARPLAAQLGARGFRTDPSRMSFTVIQRNPDGSISQRCVTGEEAAVKALHGAPQGGQHHEH
jgi:hypothetical protein